MSFGTYDEEYNPYGTVLLSDAGTEYAVMHVAYPDEPHRGPWSKEMCEDWIRECKEMGMREGAFYMVSRKVSAWGPVD